MGRGLAELNPHVLIGAGAGSRSQHTARRGKYRPKRAVGRKLGMCGFLRKQITETTKNVEYEQGIAVSWVSNKSPRAPTSSFAVEIQSMFYGFDMDRMLKGLLAALLFANIGVAIPTYVRNDNSTVAYQVDSVNTVTNEKRLNGPPKAIDEN